MKVKQSVRGGWWRRDEEGAAGGRPGPCQRRGPGAGGEGRRGRTGRRCGGRGGGALGPSRPGRGGGGEPGAGPPRRRAGLAPDLTFWVRACVQEARWGRGRGREAVREVPGWLASAPFALPLLAAPEGTGPQGPRREAGGALLAGPPRSRPGPGTLLSGLRGSPGIGTRGSSPRAGAPRPPLPAPPGSPGGASSEIGGGSVPGYMVPPSSPSP